MKRLVTATASATASSQLLELISSIGGTPRAPVAPGEVRKALDADADLRAVLFIRRAETCLADRLAALEPSETALAAWVEEAAASLEAFRPHRRRLLLLDADEAVAFPDATLAHLKAWFDDDAMPGLAEADDATDPDLRTVALQLAARALLDARAVRLDTELAAACSPISDRRPRTGAELAAVVSGAQSAAEPEPLSLARLNYVEALNEAETTGRTYARLCEALALPAGDAAAAQKAAEALAESARTDAAEGANLTAELSQVRRQLHETEAARAKAETELADARRQAQTAEAERARLSAAHDVGRQERETRASRLTSDLESARQATRGWKDRLAAATEELAAARAHVAKLENENEILQGTVDAIRASTSWRITAPVRAVALKSTSRHKRSPGSAE